MLCITQNFLFYFSYGKLSLLLSIGIDGTFWKEKIEEMCECQYLFMHNPVSRNCAIIHVVHL